MSDGPVVIAMLTHRDPDLLQRTTSAMLQGSRTAVLVHHDPRGVPHGLVESDRLRLVPNPGPCDWGRMNLAEAMITCIRESFAAFPDLSWILLASGQDYPAQSLSTTEQQLGLEQHDALVRHFPVPADGSADEHHWQAQCRTRYLHRMRLPRTHRSVPCPRLSPFKNGTRLFIGDMWFNLNAAAAQHVLAQYERMTTVRRYLARCSVPDEALVPTLLLNDADHLRITNERKRFIRWVPGTFHPNTLDESDAMAIASSGDFFARKVDGVRSAALLDRLDAVFAAGPA